MKLCTHCRENQGVFLIQQVTKKERKEEFLCLACLQSTRLHASPSQTELTAMIKNIIQTQRTHPDMKKELKPKKRMRPDESIQLEDYCLDLTAAAKKGDLDSLIGREEETERLIHILNRRQKNNPVLIGEPGVGKTAIVEGLAYKIACGDVPEKMKNKRVLSLDLTSVLAGTMYRGMFEERIRHIVKEVEKDPSIILFIDEIHMIVGAGTSMDNKMDASNILKPYLSRGKIQLIGSTTLREYKTIEKDSALERRFQSITVNEPSPEETLTILKGLKSQYEAFHHVSYSDEVLQACITLSDRFLPERFMPDKAIDLLDEVGAKANLLQNPSHAKEQLQQLEEQEQQAVLAQDYEAAIQIRKTITQIRKENQYTILLSDVEAVLEKMTGIPVHSLNDQERHGLQEMESRLNLALIGQPAAVKTVTDAVKRHRMNLRKRKKPISFLFTGPTGVGKTELTKQLAKELFGSDDFIIRFDMSEFMESHAISKLIGSPPGYAGHEESGQLTEKVRRNPYSIVLLDEFEKAHSSIQHLFLQVFDDGRLTDSHGKTIDFSNTIIILTSNIGADVKKPTGFLEKSHALLSDAIHRQFTNEFINRLDAIVSFEPLTHASIITIVDLLLKEVIEGLAEKQISFTISEEAKSWLSTQGYDEKFGARPLYRTIVEHIEQPIIELLLSTPSLTSIAVEKQGDRLSFISS